jgi:excisionase family DNA binding protein
MATDEGDLLSSEEAAELLGVDRERIRVMVDEGMLTPVDDGDGGERFLRAEVEATRLLGG